MEKNIFTKYQEAVNRLLISQSKERAIELSGAEPRPRLITRETVRDLIGALDCEGWKIQKGSNWVWRDSTPAHTKGHSKEVSLEREIAALDTKRWSCQMSTSSGVQPNMNRRSAIDLVRHIGNGRYAFIELKVGSNNPLFGAFEILGYALAYLHARKCGWKGKGPHDVFDAKKIELTVLGPERWYEYRNRRETSRKKFEFQWLADEINESLNAQGGVPEFSMVFRRFPDEPTSPADLARVIDKLARDEWWSASHE